MFMKRGERIGDEHAQEGFLIVVVGQQVDDEGDGNPANRQPCRDFFALHEQVDDQQDATAHVANMIAGSATPRCKSARLGTPVIA